MDDKNSDFSPNFDGLEGLSGPELERAAAQRVTGHYDTAWPSLKAAVVSATIAALQGDHQLRTATDTMLIDPPRMKGEISFLTDLRFELLVHGPALGAVSTCAFAIESLLRLCFVLATELRLQRSQSERSKGLPSSAREDITAFDKSNATSRLRMTAKALGTIPKTDTRSAYHHLFQLRNSLVHDDPTLYTSRDGARRAGDRRYQESFGPYTALRAKTRPIRLKHVRAAIDCHDGVVDMVATASRFPQWKATLAAYSYGYGIKLKEAMPGLSWYRDMRRQATQWEREYQTRTTATLEEELLFRSHLNERYRNT